MRSKRSILFRILLTVPVIIFLFLGITSCGTTSAGNLSSGNRSLTVLSAITGSVQINKSGSGNWSDGQEGMTLAKGDQIKTSDSSTASVTFFDGSVIKLNSDAQISLDELIGKSSTSPKTIKIGQKIGETTSTVVKLIDPASIYEIETSSAVAGVRGTIMQVSVSIDGSTSVANVEGTVSVTAQGKEVIIPPGQHSIIEQ